MNLDWYVVCLATSELAVKNLNIPSYVWVHAAYIGGEDSQSTKLGPHTVDQHLRGKVIFHAAWELSLYPYNLEFHNAWVDKTEEAPFLLGLTYQYTEEDQ